MYILQFEFPTFFFFCFFVVHVPNGVNQEWTQRCERWQSCNIFCLFNLEACDIPQESRGGISCHWGGGSTFPPSPRASTQGVIYTADIYLCVSEGETQYPPSKFLVGQRGSERESKTHPCQNFKTLSSWDRSVWSMANTFLTGFWTYYFVNITLLHHVVGVVLLKAVLPYVQVGMFIGQFLYAWHYWNITIGKLLSTAAFMSWQKSPICHNNHKPLIVTDGRN